jgi:hypothetical protein
MLSKSQESPHFSFLFSPSFLSLFFRRREGGVEGTVDCARGYGAAQGQLTAFITLRCHNRGGKMAGPYKAQ